MLDVGFKLQTIRLDYYIVSTIHHVIYILTYLNTYKSIQYIFNSNFSFYNVNRNTL